jgi:hypothetical protein
MQVLCPEIPIAKKSPQHSLTVCTRGGAGFSKYVNAFIGVEI